MNFAYLAGCQAIIIFHGPTRSKKTVNFFVCGMNVKRVILSKTFFTKHCIVCILYVTNEEERPHNKQAVPLSSLVSMLDAGNAWDQDSPFDVQDKTACILGLGLSYGSLSNKLFFLIMSLLKVISQTCRALYRPEVGRGGIMLTFISRLKQSFNVIDCIIHSTKTYHSNHFKSKKDKEGRTLKWVVECSSLIVLQELI